MNTPSRMFTRLGSRWFVPMVVVASVVTTAACGATETASGPYDTALPVAPRAYATIPPVTEPATTAPAAQPTPGEATTIEIVHLVEAGESISIIAAKYQIDPADLASYNGFGSPDQLINPGERLRIPPGAIFPATGDNSSDGTASNSQDGAGQDNATSTEDNATADGDSETNANSEQESTQEGNGCTYVIGPGDNPSKVANKVGVTLDALVKANQSSGVLTNFLLGDKLIIPPPGNC